MDKEQLKKVFRDGYKDVKASFDGAVQRLLDNGCGLPLFAAWTIDLVLFTWWAVRQ